MKQVKVSDFSEETFWAVQCPYCQEYVETIEDPMYLNELFCGECGEDFEIVNE